ncbi:hypothetical protein PtA15_10A494 [Puccinia triticina]|uniref:SP-RING-type domain-containing protein n=1 Tax=Puccinia triticina TaxID=208348 RepID=A0ABY7CV06_9BASI|nr:uncharacterized protein PtA15_10A494 [Puccinia triticina]WAQ89071.1 hypothetical protein PtA15_10A494 [Puccinia triticina]
MTNLHRLAGPPAHPITKNPSDYHAPSTAGSKAIMSQLRPMEFWENYDRNVLMLDLIQRKLQNNISILEVSKRFIRTMRDGDLLAIEFIPHLAEFCEKTADWFDLAKLSMLGFEQLRAVFNMIKSIKTAVEHSNDAIRRQGVYIHGQNPVEYHRFHVADLNAHFARFKEKVQADIRRRQATSTLLERETPSSNQNVPTNRVEPAVHSRSSTVGASVDRKPSPPLFLETDSDTSESDDTDNPFQAARRKSGRARHEEQKPDVSEEPGRLIKKTSQEPSSPPIDPEADSEQQKRSVSDVCEPGHDILEPGRFKTEPSPELSPPRIKPEAESAPEASAAVVEERKRALADAHNLSSNVLGDLWMTHHILRSSNKLKITEKVKEMSFRLAEQSEIDRLTYPRSLHQTSLSKSSEDEDEKQALPTELVIIVEILLQSDQTLLNPSRHLKITINRKELLVHKFHEQQSSIKLILPVQPEYLKVGYNKVAVKHSKEGRTQMQTTKVDFSVELVTVLSEKEAFEKAIRLTCPAHRTEFLKDSSSSMSLVDPISRRVSDCPVRGVNCQHFQCFDLRNFIELHRFKSHWTCPFESCKKSCNPLELEFDNYVLENIAKLTRSQRSQAYQL